MKVDRLLAIIMYLMNRDIVSANALAEKFEVSTRTIQRDIDSLTLAGIPIYSVQGALGGYGIMKHFKLDKQFLNIDDFLSIITALKGLASAYENRKIEKALEKIRAIYPQDKLSHSKGSSHLFIDFSVFNEPLDNNNCFSMIEEAILNNKILQFEYTDANYNKTVRSVQPLALVLKWYAWYVFSFCQVRQDYRLFKLARIRDVTVIEKTFNRGEEDIEKLINNCIENKGRDFVDLKLICKSEVRVSIQEYFSGGEIIQEEEDSIIIEITLPKDEPHWLGIILSYGDKVEILEPKYMRRMVLEKIKGIRKLYL